MIQLSNIGPPGRMRFARGSNPVIPRHQLRRSSAGTEPSACRHAQRRAAAGPSAADALLVLRAQVGEHFVALGDGDQPAEDGGNEPGSLGVGPERTRRGVLPHGSTL